MGDRASYMVIEHGNYAVYYDHWGAISTPAVVVSGPAETLAYLRELKPATRLLDTTWAEGGILLDADTQTLIFWGGIAVPSRPYLRRLLMPALQIIWQGWRVSWAVKGIVDFAEYPGVARALGIDPTSVIDDSVSMVWDPYPASEIHDPHAHPWISTVVTVRWAERRVADYTFDRFPAGYLTFGASLLDVLYEREPDTLPREDGDGENVPHGGAYVDVLAHTLWVWEPDTLNRMYIERVKGAWPGWQVEAHIDGLAYQMTLSGRDPESVKVPTAQVITELMHELTDDDTSVDPTQIGQIILAHADLATTQFAPGFFQIDRPPATSEAQSEWLMRLLVQVAQEQEGVSSDH